MSPSQNTQRTNKFSHAWLWLFVWPVRCDGRDFSPQFDCGRRSMISVYAIVGCNNRYDILFLRDRMMFDNLTIKTHTVCAHVALMIFIFHEPTSLLLLLCAPIFIFVCSSFSSFSPSLHSHIRRARAHTRTRNVVKFTCRRSFRPRGRRFNARRLRIER